MSDALAKVLETLPAHDIGTTGKPGSPLTLVFIGTKEQVGGALKRAGWTSVPRSGYKGFVEGLGQLVIGRKITKFPPFHRFFVEGKEQDENWAQVVHSISKRHHFRLWRVKESTPEGREIWWGSGSYDMGIRWKFIIPITHIISPDISAERDYVARSLLTAPGVVRIGVAALPQIALGGITNNHQQYFTDGRALVVEFGP